MRANFFTPSSSNYPTTPLRHDRHKRFMRKPNGSSERSSSKKSIDSSSRHQIYIKSPGSSKKLQKHEDFFVTLASQILKTNHECHTERDGHKPEPTERTTLTQWDQFKIETKIRHPDQNETIMRSLNSRIKNLQATLELKNHEAEILSGQCQRMKKAAEEQKQKRRRLEAEKKEVAKQLREATRANQAVKLQLKKLQKQKQSLSKQIQFLQRINFDQNTRSLQSYRETYLEQQVKKMRKQFHKTRGERQNDLESQIKHLKEQKYSIESHLKAMKVANECLIKQVNNFQQGLQEIVLNSDEYKKLRDKYVRFLQEYKLLRNEYWSLKAEMHDRNGGANSEESGIFSITASEVEADLSQLKGCNENTTNILGYLKQNQNKIR